MPASEESKVFPQATSFSLIGWYMMFLFRLSFSLCRSANIYLWHTFYTFLLITFCQLLIKTKPGKKTIISVIYFTGEELLSEINSQPAIYVVARGEENFAATLRKIECKIREHHFLAWILFSFCSRFKKFLPMLNFIKQITFICSTQQYSKTARGFWSVPSI